MGSHFSKGAQSTSSSIGLESISVLDQIYGTLYGQCIGDAIGLLTEFMVKKDAKLYYGKSLRTTGLEYGMKVDDLHRFHFKTGDWTDDSDQMLAILQSLLDMDGEVDVLDVASKFHGWLMKGVPELGKGCMGLGSTTGKVLRHPQYSSDPHKVAWDIWENSGRYLAPNGAVMRTSVLGIHDFKTPEKVVDNAINVCKCTHADPRCIASCVAVTSAISVMLRREERFIHSKDGFDVNAITQFAFDTAVVYVEDETQKAELRAAMFAKDISELNLTEFRKIGYTLKCLGAGFWALRQDSFKQALTTIVMEAGDADTNGAVAGALLGCKFGTSGLPKNWLNELRHKEWLDKKIDSYIELLTRMGTLPSQEGACKQLHELESNVRQHATSDKCEGESAEQATSKEICDERQTESSVQKTEGGSGSKCEAKLQDQNAANESHDECEGESPEQATSREICIKDQTESSIQKTEDGSGNKCEAKLQDQNAVNECHDECEGESSEQATSKEVCIKDQTESSVQKTEDGSGSKCEVKLQDQNAENECHDECEGESSDQATSKEICIKDQTESSVQKTEDGSDSKGER